MEESKISETAPSPRCEENSADNESCKLPNSDRGAEDGGSGGRQEDKEYIPIGEVQPPLSKNQQRKLKRRQEWEEGRDDRKRRRKEKRQDQKARKRTEREAKMAEAEAAGLDPAEVFLESAKRRGRKVQLVPVSIIIDCDFEEYMREGELVSIASQMTRCYSDNRGAEFSTHLFVSSWRGLLKTRFETVLRNNHTRWHNANFVEDDFVAAGKQARELMGGLRGGIMIDLLKGKDDSAVSAVDSPDRTDPAPCAKRRRSLGRSVHRLPNSGLTLHTEPTRAIHKLRRRRHCGQEPTQGAVLQASPGARR